MSENHSPKERFQLWRKGWKAGASAAASAYPEDSDYVLGYNEGTVARMEAAKDAYERLGITSKEVASWVLR